MTDVTSPVPQFVHCNVTAIEPDIEIGQKNRQFKLFFTLIKLSIQPSIRLPFYLQGAQIHIQDQILYWISPGKHFWSVLYLTLVNLQLMIRVTNMKF